jgi:hypothetical protein
MFAATVSRPGHQEGIMGRLTANECPREPDQRGRQPQLLGLEQPPQMGAYLSEAESFVAVGGLDLSTGLQLLQSQTAWSVVLGGDFPEAFNDFLVLTLR